MREFYDVRCPKRIRFGDPIYFEDPANACHTVDFQPPAHFRAKVKLEETWRTGYSYTPERTMTFYFAPEETMDIYLRDLKDNTQTITGRYVHVSTSEYLIQADGCSKTFCAAGYEDWGCLMELSHTIQGKDVLDAVILLVNMPDGESMEDMRGYLKTLLQDVRPAEGLAETEYGESISETQQSVGPGLAIHL